MGEDEFDRVAERPRLARSFEEGARQACDPKSESFPPELFLLSSSNACRGIFDRWEGPRMKGRVEPSEEGVELGKGAGVVTKKEGVGSRVVEEAKRWGRDGAHEVRESATG